MAKSSFPCCLNAAFLYPCPEFLGGCTEELCSEWAAELGVSERSWAALRTPEPHFNAHNTCSSYIQYVWGAPHTCVRDTATGDGCAAAPIRTENASCCASTAQLKKGLLLSAVLLNTACDALCCPSMTKAGTFRTGEVYWREGSLHSQHISNVEFASRLHRKWDRAGQSCTAKPFRAIGILEIWEKRKNEP